MLFSSVQFVFLFLPIVLFLYYISNRKFKNIILVAASLIFYACGEGVGVLIMAGSIVINYLAGFLIGRMDEGKQDAAGIATRRKLILIIAIVLDLGILYVFKYLDYTIKVTGFITGKQLKIFNIALPIGISFFTFQAMSYVIDVYRKQVSAARDLLEVALYISFFPQLIAGPIVRYNTISEQIRSERRIDLEKFGEGAKRFLAGFSKKILLANNLALAADFAFGAADIHSVSVATAWISSIAYSLQIYFDFSGYSDMAIGLGKMFGFDFHENFDYPYISRSVTEFWRRWHISLSGWFRDYVYIPLGGSRAGTGRHIWNLFVVWLLTGIWHGANITFVLWGLIYFLALVLEKYVIKPEKRAGFVRVCWMILTLLLVNMNWMLFRIESFRLAGIYLKSMFGRYQNALFDGKTMAMLREYGCFLAAGLLFSTPVAPKIEALLSRSKAGRVIRTWGVPVVYLWLFLWSVSYLVLGSYNPFIYFNF